MSPCPKCMLLFCACADDVGLVKSVVDFGPDLPDLALSIMQPWAWLIVNGHKAVENRTWSTRFRGPVAIHAGKKIDQSAAEDLEEGIHPVTWKILALDTPPAYDAGGIVGVGEIVDVVTSSDDEWFVGEYGIVIANARPVPFIPVKGALGFFNWRDRVRS